MAVTKTVPAADVAVLLDLGLTLFGENRAQEAGAKVAEVAALRPDASPRWHFIGGLQRNKARAVVAWADRVESVDSVRLADALDRAAARACDEGRRTGPLPVLLQYSVDGDPERGRRRPRRPARPGRPCRRLRGHCASTGSWPSRRWTPTPRRPSRTSPTRPPGCVPPIRPHPPCRPV